MMARTHSAGVTQSPHPQSFPPPHPAPCSLTPAPSGSPVEIPAGPHPCTPQGAGRDLAHATVAQTLRRLERDDLVTRSLHEVDRRRVFVRLTERGRAVCGPLVAEGAKLGEEIRETLGAEGEAQLHRALTLLTQRWQTPVD